MGAEVIRRPLGPSRDRRRPSAHDHARSMAWNKWAGDGGGRSCNANGDKVSSAPGGLDGALADLLVCASDAGAANCAGANQRAWVMVSESRHGRLVKALDSDALLRRHHRRQPAGSLLAGSTIQYISGARGTRLVRHTHAWRPKAFR